ncbi:MAG TPA: hypothetical protein VNO19_01945 [Gemmatimonadales bacterium]|nr:hypothetical protein [Gemmatimonadales bacterium]
MKARMTVLALLCVPTVALAQVGHSPTGSPYRDVRKGHTITATGGYFGGSGGVVDVGPHRGEMFGGRYDIRSASALQIGLAVSQANLKRFILNPTLPPENRLTGPVQQSVTFVEIALQFNLTGGKSWHRIAPFIGSGFGLALASDTPADALFDFGNKFYLAPNAGLRFFLSDRLHLRGEARAAFWKLTYPSVFENERSEWIVSPWLQVGVGYSFSP